MQMNSQLYQIIPQQIKRYSFCQNVKYAIKLEDSSSRAYLKNEQQILKLLNESQAQIGQKSFFPKFFESGFIKPFNYIVMEYLDEQIKLDIRNSSEIKELTKQCFQAIRAFHSIGYIHRDVRLENFLQQNGQLYLIDFGSASEYMIDNTLKPLVFNQQQEVNMITASFNSLAGFQSGRIDDYISIINSMLLICQQDSPLRFNLPDLNDDVMRGLVYQQRLQLREEDFDNDCGKRLFRIHKLLVETYFDQYNEIHLKDFEIDQLIEKIDEPIDPSIRAICIPQIVRIKKPLKSSLSSNQIVQTDIIYKQET
ncbi:ck1 family protein kinase [Stylonychia lemnae]|uniref:Casein kinase I n=1 Tax=Stylonychia lemnae TaxID=5949 RepID=A0A078BBV6_STYLE|nr:ck1 family protein kinase [Stylonychia lemnae]|eukprot:CDW91691.1 ck1 family protein kinase [Stylonychia lemnae]